MAINLPMTEVIAERTFEITDRNSDADVVTIQIGKPAPDPTPGGDWYCPIRVAAPGQERVQPLYGVDAIQCLQFAIGILELQLKRCIGDREVTWLGQSDLGLGPWIPPSSKDS